MAGVPNHGTMSRPIRVAHVIRALESGGAEQQLLALTRSLDPAGWEPIVVCTHYLGPLGPDYAKACVPVEVLGVDGRRDQITVVPRLARALARMAPDIVHTWLFTGNAYGRVAALFLPRRPVLISTERNIEVWKKPAHHAIDRVLARWTDAIVGNAAQVSDFVVREQGIPADKVTTIRNGITLDRAQRCIEWSADERRAYRISLGIPADAFVVGFIARPSWEKRLDILVEVIAALHADGVPVRLLHLGRDPLPEEAEFFAAYERTIDARGIRSIVVRRGFVRDVSPELAIMDALLQTSDVEGFPNAVTEALAMEVPVVATDAGGTSDLVIHGRTGWLVPAGDVAGLIAGLRHVRAHPDEARAWGRAGRAHVEASFSVGALVANTTALYARLLRRHGVISPEG